MSINHALSVRTDFSIGESMFQVEQIIDAAKAQGYESVAITDTMSINAMPDFSAKAKKAGIKPIIGCRIRVVQDPEYRKPSKSSGIPVKDNPLFAVKVYAKDERGIKSLFKLLSKGSSEKYFYYHARVGLADLLELEGVAVTTGDMFGVFALQDEDYRKHVLRSLKDRFGSDLYAELPVINTPLFDTLNARTITEAKAVGIKPLVTRPAFYHDPDDAETLEVLGAITSNSRMDVGYRNIQYVKTFSLLPPRAMIGEMAEAHNRVAKYNGVDDVEFWKQGFRNIGQLADACTYVFENQPISLPVMAPNEFMALGQLCANGWNDRLKRSVLGYKPEPEQIPLYKERLRYELSVLKSMGFSNYFLLVEDLVTWSKKNDIIVGPGRGSVGGSLVAYLLGITDVDPIRFGLIFERFINPDRLDLPDADLDFMSSRRHEIVDYLVSKYGRDKVAGISNYSTLASASALRDTGRVHNFTGIELTATKLVPKEHGQSFTLTEAANAVPEIEKFKLAHPKIWTHAIRLEGVMRSLGQHAAGVVVGGVPLMERAVIESRNPESPVVNWDKRSVESWGLVKMDILGLSTLDTLDIAKRYIYERHGKRIDYLKLSLEEHDVMDAFGKGDTTGVFQSEGQGARKLLRDMALSGRLEFNDIVAMNALNRPGPLDSGLAASYVRRKQGAESVDYPHPRCEAALKETLGIMIYQEQLMQIARDLCGFSMAEADTLRKAIGKKDSDLMRTMKDKFITGAVEGFALAELPDGTSLEVHGFADKTGFDKFTLLVDGMTKREAETLWDQIEAFSAYSFNKSHSVEYSIISVWTMWLRVRYPAEYFAACLSIVPEDKLSSLVTDARQYGIEVIPPDINLSASRFTVPDDTHILTPFTSILGISDTISDRIVHFRSEQGGKFKDLETFKAIAASKGSKINARVVDRLEKVGALYPLDPTSLAPRHMDRRKDQTELMPGLIIDAVKATRSTDGKDKFVRAKILTVLKEYRECEDCSLKGQPHPAIRMGGNVKYMVVFDCPSWQEEKKDSLLEGDAAAYVKRAIKAAGMSPSDGYFTTLVKAKKDDKFLTNQQLNGCRRFIERELEIIKPPLIIALGSAAVKYFVPSIKGGVGEHAGRIVYDSKLEASIVCGINPQQIGFNPSMADVLDEVFLKAADVLS